MAIFDKNLPAGNRGVDEGDDAIRANNAALEEGNQKHQVFPGTEETKGRLKPESLDAGGVTARTSKAVGEVWTRVDPAFKNFQLQRYDGSVDQFLRPSVITNDAERDALISALRAEDTAFLAYRDGILYTWNGTDLVPAGGVIGRAHSGFIARSESNLGNGGTVDNPLTWDLVPGYDLTLGDLPAGTGLGLSVVVEGGMARSGGGDPKATFALTLQQGTDAEAVLYVPPLNPQRGGAIANWSFQFEKHDLDNASVQGQRFRVRIKFHSSGSGTIINPVRGDESDLSADLQGFLSARVEVGI